MADSRAIERPPLLVWNRPLVPDRQRRDYTRVRSSPERGEDSIANRLAQPFDIVAWPARERIDAPVCIGFPHIPGRSQIVLEQPGLEIETVRIDRSVRALQAHDKLPALAGMRLRGLALCVAVAVLRCVPCERDPRRYDRAWRQHPLDLERETRAAIDPLRQLVDDADQLEVMAFPGRGQRVGEAQLSAPCCVKEPCESDGRNCNRYRGRSSCASAVTCRAACDEASNESDREQDRDGSTPREWRKLRPLLQRQHTQRECEQQTAHRRRHQIPPWIGVSS